MATRTVEVVRNTAAAPQAVWALLADITTWTDWGLFDDARLERPGEPEPNGVGAIRNWKADRMRSRDEVFAFEPPRRLGYVVLDNNLPVRNQRSDVQLTEVGGGTEIWWRTSYEPKVLGTGWFLDRNFKIFLSDTARRLAVRAETGAPAPGD